MPTFTTPRWIAGGANHPGTTLPSNITGDCPHYHRTPEAAQACIERHDAAVKRGHGANAYSDRRVIEVDGHGVKRPTPERQAELDRWDR